MTSDPSAPSSSRAKAALAVGLALGAVLLLGIHLTFDVFVVAGASMAPDLEPGRRVLAIRPGWVDLERGDVVVLRNPLAPGELLIKRVLALPGEEVRARGGRLYVGRYEMAEPYLAPGPALEDLALVRVPDGHVFVLGDNRSQSVDSRRFGPVPRRLLEGVVVGRLWGAGP